MVKRKAILHIDGGICSQIFFFARGLYLERQGYDVKYDLRWFKNYGKDMDNKFDRSFVMNKAFPNLKYKVASDFFAGLYEKYFTQDGIEAKKPYRLYIKKYEGRQECFTKYKDIFAKYFNPVDLNLVQDLATEIQQCNSCAVHVRRGDLSSYDPYYGNPPTVEYFIKAINYVLQHRPDSVFYFFSDEMDWVSDNIIPALGNRIKYKICDKNGSDKGYLDLYLISRAKSIIASQGSFGSTARDLTQNPDLLFVSMKDINLS